MLNRQRFAYMPRPYPATKVHAARLEPMVSDRRSGVKPTHMMSIPAMALPADGEHVDVALPAGFETVVADRVNGIVMGSGPELTLAIDVQRLRTSRQRDVRRVEVELALGIFVGSALLLSGGGTSFKELTGPPYDNRELEDLHRACVLEAFDYVLASETNIATVNRIIDANFGPPAPKHAPAAL